MFGRGGGEVFEHEEVAEGRDVSECLDDNVEVIVFFDVVHADETRAVLFAGEIPGVLGDFVELHYFFLGEFWIYHEFDVL